MITTDSIIIIIIITIIMKKLEQLHAHDLCVGTKFDVAVGAFTFRSPRSGHGKKETRQKGLLNALNRAFPMAEHGPDDCPHCRLMRRSHPKIRTALVQAAKAELRPTLKRRQSGLMIPLVVDVVDVVVDDDDVDDDGLAETAMKLPAKCTAVDDIQHGICIDEDMQRFLETGPQTVIDACSMSLLDYIHGRLKWRPVAAQVAMTSPSLHLATAMDLLCIDQATETQLYLVEVKSTRCRQGTPTSLDACYRRSINTAGNTGFLANLDMSRYKQHQLQLWAMTYVLDHDMGIQLDGATVLRTGPGGISAYPLDKTVVKDAQQLANRVRETVDKSYRQLGQRRRR